MGVWIEKKEEPTFWRLEEGEGGLSSDEEGRLVLLAERDPLLRLVETILLLSLFLLCFSLWFYVSSLLFLVFVFGFSERGRV